MRFALLASLASVFLAGVVSAETITGEYVEARNSNMWAGPCVFNAEIGITGDMAVMAWKVNDGEYENVRLDGLSVVAVVHGDETFGIGEKVKTKTIFIVDARANQSQREALIKMARSLAGDTIQEVLAVKPTKIKMNVGHDDQSGYSVVDAGIAKMRTRAVREADHTCGNERMAYPTLAEVTDEHAAYTLQNEFTGKGLPVKVMRSNSILSGVIAKFSL